MVLFNKHLVSLPHIRSELSGSTAITALLESNGLLTVANVGDSRCMIGKMQHGILKVECLSTDHTPYVASEASRIIAKQVRSRACTSNLERLNLSLERIFASTEYAVYPTHVTHSCMKKIEADESMLPVIS